MNLLPKILPLSEDERRMKAQRDVLRSAAKIGGELFGPIPKNHRREFFCLDRHTWVWHEEWIDSQGKRQIVTTNYTVRPGGILKSQNGHPYQRLSDSEFRNFHSAAMLYGERVPKAIQKRLQTA